MRISRYVFILLAGLLPAACLTQAETGNMVVGRANTPLVFEGTALHQAVTLGKIDGWDADGSAEFDDQLSRPDFAEALTRTLSDHNMLSSDPKSADFTLDAHVASMETFQMGMDYTVQSLITYRLRETATRRVRMDETVRSSFTAGMGDAFVITVRKQLANEGAVRESLAQALHRLKTIVAPQTGTTQ